MTAEINLEPLPIVRAGDLTEAADANRWLVEGLWSRAAVGFIGGLPKLGKTWLGLDLALSVATGTACLGRFNVSDVGETLVYLAEDHPSEVRQRLSSLCRHRGLDVRNVGINVITSPSLRLDLEKDRRRLTEAVRRLSPKLILLDPLVRLHRRNENDATDVSELLAYLRELQRACDVAIAVVHHMRKSGNGGDGQALRGSGDFHAWTDSALYLGRFRGRLTMRVEHRSAPSPPPVELELVADVDDSVHLEVKRETTAATEPVKTEPPLSDRITDLLRAAHGPLMRADLRRQLRTNNERVGHALTALEKEGVVCRTEKGWCLAAGPNSNGVPRSAFSSTPPSRRTERRNADAK